MSLVDCSMPVLHREGVSEAPCLHLRTLTAFFALFSWLLALLQVLLKRSSWARALQVLLVLPSCASTHGFAY